MSTFALVGSWGYGCNKKSCLAGPLPTVWGLLETAAGVLGSVWPVPGGGPTGAWERQCLPHWVPLGSGTSMDQSPAWFDLCGGRGLDIVGNQHTLLLKRSEGLGALVVDVEGHGFQSLV